MRFHRLFLPVCFIFSGLVYGAYTIEPAAVTLRSDRGENSAWLDLEHTGGGTMAIELVVYERDLDIDGELKVGQLRRSDDFIVHPAQIILAPREKAKVQVVYKAKKPAADKAYLLHSKEVPLKVGDDEAGGVRVGVQALMNYYSVIAVSTGKPGRLTVVSAKPIEGGKVEVIAENKSAGRVVGDRLVIKVGNRRIVNFTGKKNSVMPGQVRRFTFDFDGTVTAREISFEYN